MLEKLPQAGPLFANKLKHIELASNWTFWKSMGKSDSSGMLVQKEEQMGISNREVSRLEVIHAGPECYEMSKLPHECLSNIYSTLSGVALKMAQEHLNS